MAYWIVHFTAGDNNLFTSLRTQMQISVANVQIVYQLMPPGMHECPASCGVSGRAWEVATIMEGRVCGGCEFQVIIKPTQNGALGFIVATIKQSSWTIQLIYAGNLMELCCFLSGSFKRLDRYHLLHSVFTVRVRTWK